MKKIIVTMTKNYEKNLKNYARRKWITPGEAMDLALAIIPFMEAHQDQKLALVDKEGNVTEIDGI